MSVKRLQFPLAKKKTTFWVFILFLFGALLLLGGFGVEVVFTQYLGILVGVLIIVLVWLRKRKLKLPPFIILYSLFLILFIVNSFVISVDTKKSLEVFSLFLGGGLLWIAAYNLKDELRPYFDKIIIILGLIFAGLYFYNNFFGYTTLVRPWSLYLPYTAFNNHNNIGDLWAIVLTIVSYYLIKFPKNFYYWLFLPLGVYLILVSQSRAAIVALVAGVEYIAYKLNIIEKYKKYFLIFLALSVIMFLYLGTKKSILLMRPYYIQGVIGFIRTPEGVGVGNFRVISQDTANHILGLSGYSTVAHNLPLEILTGLGILGIVFIFWFIKVLISIWKEKSHKYLVYQAAFLALTVNFFFHSAYFVPTMLWLWFSCLGLAQTRAKE